MWDHHWCIWIRKWFLIPLEALGVLPMFNFLSLLHYVVPAQNVEVWGFFAPQEWQNLPIGMEFGTEAYNVDLVWHAKFKQKVHDYANCLLIETYASCMHTSFYNTNLAIRGAGSNLKVEGHGHYFRREAPEKFFRVPPPHFWLMPPLTGGTRQKCGAHVLTVILAIVNEERKT